MRYLPKKKMLSMTRTFVIRDEKGQEVFQVKDKLLSAKFSFQDMAGRELAFIAQKHLTWRPTYRVYRGGRLQATVQQRATLLRNKFTASVLGAPDIEITGNFLGNEYAIRQGQRIVARVSEKWLSLSDTYTVDVAGGADDVLILALVVIVQRVVSDRRG
jgi:uncharacterized protein YxjI